MELLILIFAFYGASAAFGLYLHLNSTIKDMETISRLYYGVLVTYTHGHMCYNIDPVPFFSEASALDHMQNKCYRNGRISSLEVAYELTVPSAKFITTLSIDELTSVITETPHADGFSYRYLPPVEELIEEALLLMEEGYECDTKEAFKAAFGYARKNYQIKALQKYQA